MDVRRRLQALNSRLDDIQARVGDPSYDSTMLSVIQDEIRLIRREIEALAAQAENVHGREGCASRNSLEAVGRRGRALKRGGAQQQ
jgi:hypothetical protein